MIGRPARVHARPRGPGARDLRRGAGEPAPLPRRGDAAHVDHQHRGPRRAPPPSRQGGAGGTCRFEVVTGPHLIAPSEDVDRQLDRRRLATELHQLLDLLAPSRRVALLLYVLDGRSTQEVAALMGASQHRDPHPHLHGAPATAGADREEPQAARAGGGVPRRSRDERAGRRRASDRGAGAPRVAGWRGEWWRAGRRGGRAMIACRTARALIVESLRGVAGDGERLALEAHLQGCEACPRGARGVGRARRAARGPATAVAERGAPRARSAARPAGRQGARRRRRGGSRSRAVTSRGWRSLRRRRSRWSSERVVCGARARPPAPAVEAKDSFPTCGPRRAASGSRAPTWSTGRARR